MHCAEQSWMLKVIYVELIVTFQGLREAIKNSDVAAVKKLLNEVCPFQIRHSPL